MCTTIGYIYVYLIKCLETYAAARVDLPRSVETSNLDTSETEEDEKKRKTTVSMMLFLSLGMSSADEDTISANAALSFQKLRTLNIKKIAVKHALQQGKLQAR